VTKTLDKTRSISYTCPSKMGWKRLRMYRRACGN
jgi:hypothetical protein